MESIYFALSYNLDVLTYLDSEVYPNLYCYSTQTTVFQHLKAILQLFQSKDEPVATIDGKPFFLFSHEHIKQWSKKEAECGGTTERWQSHKVFLLDLGMLETCKATSRSNDPVRKRIWTRAKKRKQNCETLWTVPLYDAELLQRAESIARLYHDYGISISHLRKNVIIRFRGQKRANWLYADKRVISAQEKAVLLNCHEAIRNAISEKGYTTFKEMETRVRAMRYGRQYHQQMLADLLHPEEREIRDSYAVALNHILEEKNLLCHEVGCVYRQIRKEDRDKLCISNTVKSWIIVPGTKAAPGTGREPC